MNQPNWKNRTLFHGDNLGFLRAMNTESVDLIATDPPFNKNRDFHATPDSLAAGARFQDRWSWERDVHQEWVDQIKDDYPRLLEAIESARYAHSDGMGAYMCFMAVRLLAMHRVLKKTGSIYLHCDPTASHYMKATMDAIFGHKNFLNEIVWCYGSGGASRRHYSRKHDIILFYIKSKGAGRVFNVDAVREPYSSPHKSMTPKKVGDKVYQKMHPLGRIPFDWWKIPILTNSDKRRTGYPTQKPPSLYERMIKASSNENDVVLDPFAGCATTCVAAEQLGRQWVGIDIWDKAHAVVLERLRREGFEGPDNSTSDTLALHGKVHYSKEPPQRTDEGETATLVLETINRRELPAWRKLSHAQMVVILKKAQASETDKLVICAGCGREIEPEFMELDHLNPKSSPHSTNDLSNRILLCRPCNGRKSNELTMKGLRKENKKVVWMVNEKLSERAGAANGAQCPCCLMESNGARNN